MSNPEPPPYQQPPYGQPAAFRPTPPTHGSATTAMVLGLVGLIGIMFCAGLTLVLSPVAWVIGSKSVREIDANPDAYIGREMAVAGKVMGIIGTVLLILAFLAFVAFIGWAISLDNGSFDS